MGISAVILTHDSEKTLQDTLSSVAFCDEVLVVDDGSSDDTIPIAKKMGATILTRRVGEDFSAQRNFGLAKANSPWVLFVDADEVVPVALAKEIRTAILKVDVNGFYVKREDELWGTKLKHGETGHVRLLRLGRKGKGQWLRPVHETWNITGMVGTLTIPLTHRPHPSVAEFLASINRYSTINAKHFYSEHTPVSWWHIPAYPFAKFVQNYVIRLGFLDGTAGSIVSLMMSFHSFLTRAKLWQLYHPRKQIEEPV